MLRRTMIAAAALLLFAGPLSARDLRREPLRYDFTGGKVDGWEATGGAIRPGPDGLRLDVTGAAAAILSPAGLEIDPAALDRIEIRVVVEPPTSGVSVYWTDDAGRGFVPDWKIDAPAGRSVIRLAENPAWRGKIDRLLVAPAAGARSIRLESFEVRRAEGVGEIVSDAWRTFTRTELRSSYSVNGILGAFLGPVPFAPLVGVLSVVLPFLIALLGRGRFRAAARRSAPVWLFAGATFFFARSAVDEVRIARMETTYLGGKTLMEKTAAVNPPGFFPLLLEAKRRMPEGAPVELRAPRPYPWEKGAFYLYPSRLRQGAEYVISYQTPAPPDSASWELLFRRDGVGSVYRRGTP